MPFWSTICKTYFMVILPHELGRYPTSCKHINRSWHNDRAGVVVFSRHMPTAGRDTYSLTPQLQTSSGVRRVTPWTTEEASPYVSEDLSAYPDLLNKYIVAKIVKANITVRQAGPTFARPVPDQSATMAHSSFKEQRALERSPQRCNGAYR